jgi:hypothetical protein
MCEESWDRSCCIARDSNYFAVDLPVQPVQYQAVFDASGEGWALNFHHRRFSPFFSPKNLPAKLGVTPFDPERTKQLFYSQGAGFTSKLTLFRPEKHSSNR